MYFIIIYLSIGLIINIINIGGEKNTLKII